MKKVLVFIITLWAASISIWAQRAANPALHMIVGITGENGVVALKEGMISMFSTKNIGIIDTDARKAKLVETESGAVSLTLSGLRWERTQTHLSLSTASAPPLCDHLNQINISSTLSQVSQALPKGARVKVVKEENDFVLAVYSNSKLPVKYDIRIGLLKRLKNGKYTLIHNQTVSESGSFCGIQDAGNGQYYLIVDEPSGSSDYLTVYVYSVTK